MPGFPRNTAPILNSHKTQLLKERLRLRLTRKGIDQLRGRETDAAYLFTKNIDPPAKLHTGNPCNLNARRVCGLVRAVNSSGRELADRYGQTR